MVSSIRRAATAIVAVLACALVLAGPAGAATATFGTVTATNPTVTTCSTVTCMKASGTFTYTTSYASTLVTLNVKIMRIASGSTKTSTDAVVTNQSVSFGTTKGVSLTKTLAVAQNCKTTGSYYFYTRATISNGTSSTAVQDSSVVKLTGCASV
jgi:hypothetical protein